MTNDKLQQLDKQLRELRKELEDDLLKYKDKGWLCEQEPLGEEFAQVIEDNFWEVVLK
jgi:hypothetical protein